MITSEQAASVINRRTEGGLRAMVVAVELEKSRQFRKLEFTGHEV